MNLTVKRQFWLIVGLAAALVISNMIWLYVFQSYDYVSEYQVDATGIYTQADNSGHIIVQDVSDETWGLFMEWLNGQS